LAKPLRNKRLHTAGLREKSGFSVYRTIQQKSSLDAFRTTTYLLAMSYLTVEVEIDHGQIVPKGGQTLPEKASGLLTILDALPLPNSRPIGLAKGQFTVPDDFNAPLPEETMQGFEGK
jgi:hypothetical protein